MSRKFGGRLIRIMMTKSSSCDILKKKRTIRRGSGSRPKGSYLMDLRFWNYVIPDGSTTGHYSYSRATGFWNYVIPDGSTTKLEQKVTFRAFWNYVIPDGSTTYTVGYNRHLVFWNYVIPDGSTTGIYRRNCIIAFWNYVIPDGSTTQSCRKVFPAIVLELCHSRWFYYLTVSSQ